MPIKECTENKKPGWQYGDRGKCYTWDPETDDKNKTASKNAKKKAIRQALAINGGVFKEDGSIDETTLKKAVQKFFEKYMKAIRTT
jgi:hypothetical protein